MPGESDIEIEVEKSIADRPLTHFQQKIAKKAVESRIAREGELAREYQQKGRLQEWIRVNSDDSTPQKNEEKVTG